MDMICMIVGGILVIGYIACAVTLIHHCETKNGALCATTLAIGVGAIIAYFIEYLIAIAICGIFLAIIGLFMD